MKKPDEIQFYAALRYCHAQCERYKLRRPFATDVAEMLGMHPKRALALLSKWDRSGWWDWGVSIRSGYFTAAAPATIELYAR